MIRAASLRRRALRPPRPARAGRPWLVALALAVAMLQSLGLVHRLAHGWPAGAADRTGAAHGAHRGHPSGAVEAAHGAGAVEAASAAEAATIASGQGGLFGGHAAGDSACSAFDHAALGDVALGVPGVPVAAALPPLGPVPRYLAPALAAQASGHLARGPPALG